MNDLRFRVLGLAISFLLALSGLVSGEESPHSLLQEQTEIKTIVAGTYLARDVLGEHETPEVLRRVLKRSPYSELGQEAYIALLEDTVEEWPESRLAHETLANTLIGHGESGPSFERGVQELRQAADLSFREGRVRYQLQLPYYLAVVGDEEGLHRYTAQALSLLPNEQERYSVYLAYAIALAKLKNPLAEDMFTRAIATRPIGTWAPHEAYTFYLKETRQYSRILELLSPAIVKEAVIMRSFFQGARCEALLALGRRREAKSECQNKGGERKSSSVGSLSAEGTPAPDSMKADFPHNTSYGDDCRYQSGCMYHPACATPGSCRCINAFVWNLAEVALNEAQTESPGSQNAIAWTVRNRAIRLSTSGCGGFPGANTLCTSGCPWPASPQACELQKKSCCVIHASNQFNRTHIPTANIPFHVLENMRRVVDGELPDPVSGYIPTGASGCVLNSCDGSAYCNTPGSSFDAAPFGPLYFYGNYATGYQCRGVQPGISVGCAIVAGETCGNSTDGAGSDNCYARQSRVRTWTVTSLSCGSSCSNYSTELRIGTGGYAYKTPSESPRFNYPGGKQFNVTMGLQAGSPSTVVIRLLTSTGALLYDFGTVTVGSSTLSVFSFQSYGVVTGAGDQLRIINQGPGTIKLTQVTSYD